SHPPPGGAKHHLPDDTKKLPGAASDTTIEDFPEGYPSGQRGQTVNLLAYAFGGSTNSSGTNLNATRSGAAPKGRRAGGPESSTSWWCEAPLAGWHEKVAWCSKRH